MIQKLEKGITVGFNKETSEPITTECEDFIYQREHFSFDERGYEKYTIYTEFVNRKDKKSRHNMVLMYLNGREEIESLKFKVKFWFFISLILSGLLVLKFFF